MSSHSLSDPICSLKCSTPSWQWRKKPFEVRNASATLIYHKKKSRPLWTCSVSYFSRYIHQSLHQSLRFISLESLSFFTSLWFGSFKKWLKNKTWKNTEITQTRKKHWKQDKKWLKINFIIIINFLNALTRYNFFFKLFKILNLLIKILIFKIKNNQILVKNCSIRKFFLSSLQPLGIAYALIL